jgi:hypothetical protein
MLECKREPVEGRVLPGPGWFEVVVLAYVRWYVRILLLLLTGLSLPACSPYSTGLLNYYCALRLTREVGCIDREL